MHYDLDDMIQEMRRLYRSASEAKKAFDNNLTPFAPDKDPQLYLDILHELNYVKNQKGKGK